MTADQPSWLPLLLGTAPGTRALGHGTLLVGGVGHLLLSREEEAVVTAALESRVLPLLRDLAQGRPITLFTGLAPGADLLLMERAGAWCERHGVPLRKVGLCAVPVQYLLDDWAERAEREGYALSTGDHHWLRSSMHTAVTSCDALLRFYEVAEERAMADAAVRQQRYRQLAAVLAEYSDMLIAVLKEELLGQPGGTAEVVAWRRDPTSIPPPYSTRRDGTRPPGDGGLIIVDPMPARVTMSTGAADPRHAALLQRAREAIQAGNELAANDLLFKALKQGHADPELAYLRVQVLASVGSSELALAEHARLAPPEPQRDRRWATLLGRIRKDLALRAQSRKLFLASAAAYLDAWRRFGGSYSAINAASTSALGLDFETAAELAQQALDATGSEPADTPEQRYFRAATRAEAALILGDAAAVRAHLAEAVAQRQDAVRVNRTLRQLKRLCVVLGSDAAVLQGLTLPPIVVLRRLGKARLESAAALAASALPELPAGATLFAGLCDSFDLVLIEALLAAGHTLHLVLPYRAERLVEGTRAALGEAWAARLERCLARATRIHAERGFLAGELAWSASNVSERALGLALLAGHRIGGALQIIEVEPETTTTAFHRLPSLADDRERAIKARRWLHVAEPPCEPPPERRMVGLIFADFAGFQRLEDDVLPHFWQTLMGGIAQILSRHGESILLRHTWGDALHVVTSDALNAARVMADIQHVLDLQRLKPGAPLAGLGMRIAGHYAPVYEGFDPIHAARTYYGTQLSLTARVEPVTPPGQVYATEAFAARLAFEDGEHFALEYAGEIELAKRFGDYRLYSLRRLRN